MDRASNRWAWVASGVLAMVAVGGCGANPNGATAAADGPVRPDVTDIRPLGRPSAPVDSAVTVAAPLTDASGMIPVAPQPVVPASVPLTPSAVDFSPAKALPTAAVRTHTVQPGETLFAIAKASYGDGSQWHRLAVANPAASRALRVGQQIVVP